MCTATHTYPRVVRFRRVLAIGLTAILILAGLAFIAGLILGILSSTTPDSYQADRIPVVRNLGIPVPTPAVAEIQPFASQISCPSPVGPVKSSAVSVALLIALL